MYFRLTCVPVGHFPSFLKYIVLVVLMERNDTTSNDLSLIWVYQRAYIRARLYYDITPKPHCKQH